MIDQTNYTAGVCNIDAEGVRVRRRLGFICIGVGILIIPPLFIFHVESLFRFLVIGGCAASAALNFLQAKEHFCVANAMRGEYEVGMKRTKIGRSEAQTTSDKKKMLRIYGMTLAIAIAAGSFGLLPL